MTQHVPENKELLALLDSLDALTEFAGPSTFAMPFLIMDALHTNALMEIVQLLGSLVSALLE